MSETTSPSLTVTLTSRTASTGASPSRRAGKVLPTCLNSMAAAMLRLRGASFRPGSFLRSRDCRPDPLWSCSALQRPATVPGHLLKRSLRAHRRGDSRTRPVPRRGAAKQCSRAPRRRRARRAWSFSGRGCGPSVDAHQQAVAFALHFELDQIAVAGLLGTLPRRDVEARAVQRALDLLAFDEAHGKHRLGVRADVLERVVLAREHIDADGAAGDRGGERGVFGDFVGAADVLPGHSGCVSVMKRRSRYGTTTA